MPDYVSMQHAIVGMQRGEREQLQAEEDFIILYCIHEFEETVP
jgi:hypothetical protein